MAMNGPDAPLRLRRNGQRPSCEPCRKGKLACDHNQPICNRCRSRKIVGKCHYHPAPMTTSREQRAANKASKRASRSSSSAPYYSLKSQSPALNIDIDSGPSPGWLGSTSYLATFEDTGDCMGSHSPGAHRGTHDVPGMKSESMQAAFDQPLVSEQAFRVLQVFQHVDILDQIMSKSWQLARHGTLLPNEIVERCWSSAKNQYAFMKSKQVPTGRMQREVKKLFENSSRPQQVHKDTTLDEYIDAHMDANMGWDTIAVVLGYLACATKRIPKGDQIWTELPMKATRLEFGKQMMGLAQTCIGFGERISRTDLFWLWNQAQIATVVACLYGDNSYLCWYHFGSLVSALYAAGLHQSAAGQTINEPKFVVEMRKQLIALIYVADKSISTFLGRPPRLPKKYCNLDMPLDLQQSELMMPQHKFEAFVQTLDEKGWAPEIPGRCPPVSRLSLPAAVHREEILELSLTVIPENIQEVADGIQRSSDRAYWEEIPSYWHYHVGIWSTYTTPECIQRLMTYLHYVYNGFLLQRVLVRRLRHRPDELLRLARVMLSEVLELASRQDRLSANRSDLDWIIALYGLPAAGVLALELLHQKEGLHGPPVTNFPRSEVIQKLSVLVSCLSWASEPDDGNYSLCSQAGRLLSKILDLVLTIDPVAPTTKTATEHTHITDSTTCTDTNFGDWSWFDNIEYDGEFWSQLAEHPYLHPTEVVQ